MRGEAPLEGGQLRVAEWFGYAVNKVQELAQDIGGVQQPRLSAPSGNDFPVALLTDEDKSAIPLAQPKPQVLQPIVLDRNLGDALHLSVALRARLRDLGQPATRGSAATTGRIVYLDNVNDGFRARSCRVCSTSRQRTARTSRWRSFGTGRPWSAERWWCRPTRQKPQRSSRMRLCAWRRARAGVRDS